MNEVKPIDPKSITTTVLVERDLKRIPAVVIQACNELIVENYKDGFATFTQNQFIERVLQKMPVDTTSQYVYDQKWLDIEDIFRYDGWIVNYYKSPYYSTDPCYFTFKAK